MLLLWLVKLCTAFQPMGHDWTQLALTLTLSQSAIRTCLTRRHVLTNTGRKEPLLRPERSVELWEPAAGCVSQQHLDMQGERRGLSVFSRLRRADRIDSRWRRMGSLLCNHLTLCVRLHARY